jgi:heme exporter protein A
VAGVRISNLTHEFDGREVFRSLDFAYGGACLAITGPNGSGKSTLLRILAGLLTPTAGEAKLVVDGDEIERSHVRTLIGMAAPDVRLYSELSARENIGFLLRARGLSEIERRTADALERVGLAERGDDVVGELSSGLRQRAAVAAAIAHEPPVLLLDEPSSNLDEPGIRMLHGIVEWQRARGLVVIATNDPDEAALASERLDLGAAR